MDEYGGPVRARRSNSLAIASLVLGILGVTGLGPLGIVGLVLGYRAMRQIERTGEDGYGLARAGVVLGWIAVALVAFALLVVLIGLTTPTPISGRG